MTIKIERVLTHWAWDWGHWALLLGPGASGKHFWAVIQKKRLNRACNSFLKEWLWANCSFKKSNCEQIPHVALWKRVTRSIRSFLERIALLLTKTNDSLEKPKSKKNCISMPDLSFKYWHYTFSLSLFLHWESLKKLEENQYQVLVRIGLCFWQLLNQYKKLKIGSFTAEKEKGWLYVKPLFQSYFSPWFFLLFWSILDFTLVLDF